MSAADKLRCKILGKAYPLNTETCELLAEVVEAAERLVEPGISSWAITTRRTELGTKVAALEARLESA